MEGERDAVIGLQMIVLASAIATVYFILGNYAVGAIAMGAAGVATMYFSRAGVALASVAKDDQLVPPNDFLVESVGITLTTLGVLAWIQWDMGGFPQSSAAVFAGIGAVWVLGAVYERHYKGVAA